MIEFVPKAGTTFRRMFDKELYNVLQWYQALQNYFYHVSFATESEFLPTGIWLCNIKDVSNSYGTF
jgi:hypothetical protein